MERTRILVVEDESITGKDIVDCLQNLGYEVTHLVNSGEKALRMATDPVPDLVLMDIVLKGKLDGIETARRIRELDDIPVVFLTAYSDRDTLQRAKVFGPMGYILKPFEERELYTTIEVALYKHSMERRLRESSEIIRSLLNATNDAAFLLDPDGIVLAANDAGAYRLKRDLEEITGPCFFDLLPSDQASNLKVQVRKVQQSGTTARFEEEAGALCYDTSIHPLQGGVDGERQVAIFSRDITARRNTERELRKLSKAVEQSPVSVVITDLEGRIEYVNPMFTRLTGYALHEVAGWKTSILRSELTPLETYVNLWRTITAGGEWRGEFVNRKKSGELYWEDASISPITDERGAITHYVAVKEDITGRKRRERELEAMAATATAMRELMDVESIYATILQQVMELTQAEGAMIMIFDAASGEMEVKQALGAWSVSRGLRMPAGQSLASQVMETGQPYRNDRVAEDPQLRHPEKLCGLTAAAIAPLIVRGEPIGTLWSGRHDRISNEELRLLVVIADMTAGAVHRAELQEQTARQLGRLNALRHIDQAITGSMDIRVTLDILLDQLTTQLQVDAAAVLTFDTVAQVLRYQSCRGFSAEKAFTLPVRLGDGVAGLTALEWGIVTYPPATEASIHPVAPAWMERAGFRACWGVPLIAKGILRGVLEIYHRQPIGFDPESRNYLDSLCGQAAVAIENAHLFEELRRSNNELLMSYDATLEGWAHALELRDQETQGHSKRVTDLTLRIAKTLGVSENEMIHLRRGALLHDIGKMGVPDNILLKQGQLTEEEWVVMRRHPEYAVEMISPIPFLRPAMEIPFSHHEHWDGTGYPQGLKGEQIPLGARIFAVVDVWDALSSDRPYRKAWPMEKTLDFIRSNSGSQFDPQVVTVFFELFAEYQKRVGESQETGGAKRGEVSGKTREPGGD
jgi:PAS domain S-box-containing protein/putative nucleotidyltransferase with HDIG domain